MKKYSEIKTLDELKEAIAENGRKLHRKEELVTARFDRVRNFYTPSAFLSEGARRVTRSFPMEEILLTVIGAIRHRLKKK
jgi:hypothetical protein